LLLGRSFCKGNGYWNRGSKGCGFLSGLLLLFPLLLGILSLLGLPGLLGLPLCFRLGLLLPTLALLLLSPFAGFALLLLAGFFLL
jgi:hypothetical protein